MNPTTHDSKALARKVKELARDAGFDLVGIAPAVAGLGSDKLADWLAAGKHGEMAYMERQQPARSDPNLLLDGVRSVVVVALAYRTAEPSLPKEGIARISRYAWGRDYHDVIRERLHRVADDLRALAPEVRSRAVVDSAPLMERDYGRLAGLGWFGKNTLLLHQNLGSYFFLGALLLDVELEYDVPFAADHCGTCRACLDACPTQAFDGPYQLDPRRCISYLTIEHKSPIPESLQPQMQDWLFGCDVCQDVCPWNRKSPITNDPAFQPGLDSNPVWLSWILSLTESEFRVRFRGTPLFRTGRTRLVRNAIIVAANQWHADVLPQIRVLLDDANPIVRQTAAWAIAHMESQDSNSVNRSKVEVERCVQTR